MGNKEYNKVKKAREGNMQVVGPLPKKCEAFLHFSLLPRTNLMSCDQSPVACIT